MCIPRTTHPKKRVVDKAVIDKEYLNSVFTYEDGKLYWKKQISSKCSIGKEAGTHNKKLNRFYIGLNGKYYLRSRLIYIMHFGKIQNEIDHINRNRTDDRIENLRDVSDRINTINRECVENNSRGLPNCVYYDASNKKNHYYVRARVDGKKKIIGWATTPELATELYNSYFKI